MELWIDDVRFAPERYDWCKVNEELTKTGKSQFRVVEVVLMRFVAKGIRPGEEDVLIMQNMRRIIERNGWKEVF